MKLGKLIIPVMSISLLALLSIAAYLLSIPESQPQTQTIETQPVLNSIAFKDHICAFLIRDGTTIPLGPCQHNVVTLSGLNATATQLFGATAQNFTFIGLSNQSGSSTSTTLPGEITSTDCSGLQRAGGTVIINGQTCNVTIRNLFTSSCPGPIVVNSTGLFNASSGGTLFALGNITNATMFSADQLIINHTVTCS